MMCEYNQRGGEVIHVVGDPAFEYIQNDLNKKEIKLTTCDANKYIPQVERCIRELKERIRCCRALINYKYIPSRFVREMVQQVTKLVSSIPKHNSCLHTVQSPQQIVTGIPLRVPSNLIGQYGQGHRGGTNETAILVGEKLIDYLYIGRKDNGSGYWVETW